MTGFPQTLTAPPPHVLVPLGSEGSKRRMGRKGHGRACAPVPWALEASVGGCGLLGLQPGSPTAERRSLSLWLRKAFCAWPRRAGGSSDYPRRRHLAGCKSPKGWFGDSSKVLLGDRQKFPLGRTLTPFAHSVFEPSLPNETSGIASSGFGWWPSPGLISSPLPLATRKFGECAMLLAFFE